MDGWEDDEPAPWAADPSRSVQPLDQQRKMALHDPWPPTPAPAQPTTWQRPEYGAYPPPSGPPPTPRPQNNYGPWIVAAAIAAALIISLAIIFVMRSGGAQESASPAQLPLSTSYPQPNAQVTTTRPSAVDPYPPAVSPTVWTAVIVGTCDEGGSCGVTDVRSSQGHGSSYIWYRLAYGAYVNSVYMDIQGSGLPAC